MIESPLPNNAEAESMILGCALLDNRTLDQVQEALSESDFFLPSNQKIIRAMLRLRQANYPVDPMGVADELRRDGDLEQVGGMGRIATLFDGVPRFSDITNYVRIVQECSFRRRAIATGNWLMKFAASDEYAPEELHRELARKLEALGDPQKTSPLVSSATALERTIQQLEAGWSKADGILGLPTGFTSLNRHTYGFCPSKLYTLVAPTGAGKTTLALNFAQAAVVDAGAVGLFISLEMDATELTVRSLATFSGIDGDRIIRGEFRDDSEWLAFEKAKQILAKLPIEYVDGMDAITPSRMRALIRRVKRQHKRCDFLVLDYLQLADADTKTENEAARLTKISNGLKQIAREFQIPVIALSQMNNEYLKRGWNVEPHVGDLKGSGSIAQDSDVVMFLWPLNGSDEGDNRRHLILRKNRGGKKDVKVPLLFRGDLAQFLPGDPDTFYPAGEMEATPRQNVRQRSRNLMAAY